MYVFSLFLLSENIYGTRPIVINGVLNETWTRSCLHDFQLVMGWYRSHPLFFLVCVLPYSALPFIDILYVFVIVCVYWSCFGFHSHLFFLCVCLGDFFVCICVNHLNCTHRSELVLLNTHLTKSCSIYVLWWKQQAGNIHVCKNKINKLKKKIQISSWTYLS